jgi:hypothetical protein
VKIAQAAAIVLALGGLAALAAGSRWVSWGRPLGVGLLVLAVLSQALAIQAGTGGHVAGSATPSPTPVPTFVETSAAPSLSPSSSTPLALPSVIHPHLLDAIRYATGTTALSRRSLNQEWVQLTNPSGHPITLTGWALRSSAGAVFTFPAFSLPAGASVKVHSGQGSNSASSLYWQRSTYAWNDSHDVVTLKDGAGRLVGVCRYTSTGGAASANC